MNKYRSTFVFSGAVAALMAGCGKPDTPPTPTTSAPPPAVAAVQPAPAVAPETATAPDDSTLVSRVREALLADAEVKDQQIEVSAADGVVQLSGFVDSGTQTARAAEVAGAVDGVRSVDNRLELKAGATAAAPAAGEPAQAKVDDAAITTQIKEALLADPYMNNFDVAVVTRNGEVQLSGFVANRDQADDVVALAHKTEGVKSVTSTLSVGSAESASQQ